MMKFVLLLFVGLVFSAEVAWSKGEIRYLARSPRSLLMGDAYTAHADDEYTLFYNPAGLGRSKLVELTPINPDIGVTNILDDLDRFDNFPKGPAEIADRIMGYPVYIHAGATPTLKFGPVAFSMFVNSSTSIVLRNRVYPQIDIDYRLDRGFVMGYAYSFGNGGKFEKRNPFESKKKNVPSAGRRTSIGVGVKHINRQGLQGSYSLFGSTLLGAIRSNDNDMGAIRQALGFSKGKGWGGDLGIEHAMSSGNSELAFGASILDVAGTKFKKTQGIEPVPEQEMMVNLGASWRQDFTLFDYGIYLDMHPINHNLPFSRQIHFGMEFGIPIVRAFFGLSQGHTSYGVEINLWFLKMTAGFYDVELGNDFKQDVGKRAVIYLSLLEFDFDI